METVTVREEHTNSGETEYDLTVPQHLRPAVIDACQGFNGIATKVVICPHQRPGEREYWLAMIFVPTRRYGLGTPELQKFTLEQQAPSLCEQLRKLAQALSRCVPPRLPL